MAVRPPRGLDPTGRAAWRNTVGTLTALGEDPALSRGAVERYARAVSLAASLRREWHADGAQAIRLGPRGGVSIHPLVRAIERAERHAHELGEPLGLSRARSGPTAARCREAAGRSVGSRSGEGRADATAPDAEALVAALSG